MGGRASSGGGMTKGDSNWKPFEIKNVETLKNIKDRQLYNATKAAISRYYSAMGLEQRNVKLATLPDNVLGVHVTSDGKSDGVYLNKKVFKEGTVKSVAEKSASGYKSGFSTKTNKPEAHVVTHELAHSTWNNHMDGAKQLAAGKEIRQVYRKWRADKSKKGYGSYAATNINEFWSETITKGIHGKADKYTRALKAIAKKYKL